MGVPAIDYLRGKAGPSGFGSRSTAEDVTEGVSLTHLTVIVTGGTSGIGAETVRVLVKRGAQVIVPARNSAAAEAFKTAIEREFPKGRIVTMHMDLSSLSSVRNFAAEFLRFKLPLNILINNAGVVCKKFKVSDNGFEMDFATNHLGHFLLTSLLLDKMVTTAKQSGVEGRIVNVSSSLHTWVDKQGIMLNKLNNRESFVESMNYAQTKLANILHVKELARRLQENGAYVTANALHPGVVKTNIFRDRMGFVTDAIFILASIFLKSVSQAAATVCYVATHSNIKGVTGKYFVDCNEAACSSCANDENLARELWEFSELVTRQWSSVKN